MSQYGFYFNGPRCTGCKTCELACKDYHDLAPEVTMRSVFEYTGGAWQQDGDLWSNDVFSYFVSVACNHCARPVCVQVCPTGAMHKEEATGLVRVDARRCIGCGYCALACPYRAPKVDRGLGHSVKCDGCADRVAAGLAPVCVEACPLRALEFGDVEELRAKYGETAAIAPLPDAGLTGPNLVITEPVNGKPVDDETGAVANAREIA